MERPKRIPPRTGDSREVDNKIRLITHETPTAVPVLCFHVCASLLFVRTRPRLPTHLWPGACRRVATVHPCLSGAVACLMSQCGPYRAKRGSRTENIWVTDTARSIGLPVIISKVQEGNRHKFLARWLSLWPQAGFAGGWCRHCLLGHSPNGRYIEIRRWLRNPEVLACCLG